MSRARKPRMKALGGRMQKLTTQDSWNKLTGRQGDKLTFVYFSALWAAPCKKMKPVLNDLSRRPNYSHITFVEVDVDQLSGVATAAGVKTLPTFQCWRNGKMLESVSGGNLTNLIQLLNQHAGEQQSASSRPRWQQLAGTTMQACAAVAVVFLGYQQLLKSRQTSPGSKLEVLDRQIQVLQKRVADAKRGKKPRGLSSAKSQLAELYQERAALERGRPRSATFEPTPYQAEQQRDEEPSEDSDARDEVSDDEVF